MKSHKKILKFLKTKSKKNQKEPNENKIFLVFGFYKEDAKEDPNKIKGKSPMVSSHTNLKHEGKTKT